MPAISIAKGQKISQQDNYAANFGIVLRSSAIFYYRYGQNCKTTLSFMDYWRVKNNLDITIVASVRGLDGTLLLREQLSFDSGTVCNYRPRPNDAEAFEGSIEIEAFGITNLRIPYAAVMAIYESPASVSMVHSYGRVYSAHEIEEERIIAAGEESCWTLRDTASVRSFAVFHNGANEQPAQQVTLKIRRGRDNDVRAAIIPLPAMAPFATQIIRPADYVNDLAGFLWRCPGRC